MTVTRAERIRSLKSQIDDFYSTWENADRKMTTLKSALEHAELSFDVGEWVELTIEDCQRGCCTHVAGEGIVESLTDNGCYNVRIDGELFTYNDRRRLKRIPGPTPKPVPVVDSYPGAG